MKATVATIATVATVATMTMIILTVGVSTAHDLEEVGNFFMAEFFNNFLFKRPA